MTCVEPVRIYRHMPIGQLIYHSIVGPVNNPYNMRKASKYNNQSTHPMPSMMYKNFKR
jgi:dCTP deaminase